MLDRRLLSNDRSNTAVGDAASELDSSAVWRSPGPTGLLQPRLLVGLGLIAGGILWAFARGLHFYGLTVADLGYDVDQPPLLLGLVGCWLLYRSRRR